MRAEHMDYVLLSGLFFFFGVFYSGRWGGLYINGNDFIELLKDNPIIAAVKDEDGLKKCLDSDCRVVFILSGDLCSVGEIVHRIKKAHRVAMVHLDLIDGMAARDAAVDFIAGNTDADGIISTKPNLVHHAKSCGMLAVQRFFVLDSLSLSSINKLSTLDVADALEILPGVMPKIIRRLVQSLHRPIIAGGLIVDKEDIVAALDAGAIAISSTNQLTWSM
jgi:glycerol uptake operon antiterminator